MTLCKCMSTDCYDCFHEYGADALKPPPPPGTTELDRLRAELDRVTKERDELSMRLNAWTENSDDWQAAAESAEAQVAALKAELDDHKAADALTAFFEGPDAESKNSARRAREILAELERKTRALELVLTDNAQDDLEDPIGHREREHRGFARIHVEALNRVRAALATPTEGEKP